MALAFASDGVLYHRETRKILLHHRDAYAFVNPDRWGLFGGGREPIDADDAGRAWCRELREELGIVVPPSQVQACGERMWQNGTVESLFFAEWAILDSDFVLGESQGLAWFTFAEALALTNLTPGARYFLPTLQKQLDAEQDQR